MIRSFMLGMPLGFLCFFTSVFANPNLTILSPIEGSCTPNAQTLVSSGLGDDIVLPPRVLLLELLLTDPEGQSYELHGTIDGINVILSVDEVEVDPVEGTLLQLSADVSSITDGEGRVLNVVATQLSEAGEVTEVTMSQSVSFTLDMTPPTLEFPSRAHELHLSCTTGGIDELLTLTPTATDLLDPNPNVILVASESSLCQGMVEWSAKDNCGVGNERLIYATVSEPAPAPGVFPPVLQIEGANDGEKYLETQIFYGLQEPFGCYQLSGKQTFNSIESNLFNGAQINEVGSHHLRFIARDCSGAEYIEERTIEIVPQPYADPGGPYQVHQGGVLILDGSSSFAPEVRGGIVEYAWNIDVDNPRSTYVVGPETVAFPTDRDGLTRVALRIKTGLGDIRFGFTEVDVTDVSPVCNLGGPYEGRQGEFIRFDATGSSAGDESEPIQGYYWDFGEFDGPLDEQFGIQLNEPEYFYQEEGEYLATLRLIDDDSFCEGSVRVTVTDIDPIVTGLNVSSPIIERLEGNTIQFSAGGTSAGSSIEPLVRYRWDFGDGTPELSLDASHPNARLPQHTFTDQGVYTVCLVAEDIDSESRGCFTVEVFDVHPEARIEGPALANVDEGQSMSFSLLGNRSIQPSVDPLTRITVDFGDGSPLIELTGVELAELGEYQLTHRFIEDGPITVILKAYDEDSLSEARYSLFVNDVAPRPIITPPVGVVEEGQPSLWSAVDSTAGAESDPIVLYRWNFGDGTIIEGPDLSEVNHTWSDNQNGGYTLILTLTDSDGSTSNVERIVQVRNLPPSNGQIVSNYAQIDLGLPVTFSVTYHDVAEDQVRISWRMGEGSFYPDQRNVTHAYSELGTFTVRAILTDEDGGESIVSYDIEVVPPGPTIDLEPIPIVKEGDLLLFDIHLFAARNESGDFDGPVELTLARSPRGLTLSDITEGEGIIERTFQARWQTGSEDAGVYPIRFTTRAPSGITRTLEGQIEVTENKELWLYVVQGGSPSYLSSAKYYRDSLRGQEELQYQAEVRFNTAVGTMIQNQDYLIISLPNSGEVQWLNRDLSLVRRLNLKGIPQTLLQVGLDLWVFDALEPRINLIDERLKRSREVVISELNDDLEGTFRGVSSAVSLNHNMQNRVITLSYDGVVSVLDPSRINTNQGSQAITSQSRVLLRGQQLLLWPEEELVLAIGTRDIVAFSYNDILDRVNLEPSWIIEGVHGLREVKVISDQLWALTYTSLRRLAIPTQVADTRILGEEIDVNAYFGAVQLPEGFFGEESALLTSARSLQHVSVSTIQTLLSIPAVRPRIVMVEERILEP